jgi:hypothetical protein
LWPNHANGERAAVVHTGVDVQDSVRLRPEPS